MTFRAKKVTLEVTFRATLGETPKVTFESLLSYFEFFGFRGVLAGFQDLSAGTVDKQEYEKRRFSYLGSFLSVGTSSFQGFCIVHGERMISTLHVLAHRHLGASTCKAVES